MMPLMENEISIETGADFVKRENSHVEISSGGKQFHFDQVIFACHADEALQLLDQASNNEKEILGCFNYQENIACLHTDESLMPKRKKAWCSWNYLAQSEQTTSAKNQVADKQVTATYWMNKLQRINPDKNYLVTLNPYQQIDPKKIIKQMTYHHPVFDRDAIKAQSRLDELQGINNSWFCGSYAGYGFHEDGISAAVAVCEKLGVIAPWNLENNANERFGVTQ